MQGKNLPFVTQGDVYVEITATTYENFLNLGIDGESEWVQSNIKNLATLSEKTPRVRVPKQKDGIVVWENEVNLGYFSKNAPVNLNFTVKQADPR